MLLKIKNLILAKKELVKYLISGGTAAAVDVLLLYVFTDIFKLWYITSAVLAFIGAFCVSFTLQKYWTFRDLSSSKIHAQISLYLISSVINLGINTLFMYILVDFFHIWYILSQIITSGLIAIGSFFIYKYIIFKK